jgi:hypothetical protein
MSTRAAELLLSFTEYMLAFGKDPEEFSKSGLEHPPKNTMDQRAAEEWARVAPTLYEMDRLWPREVLGLHSYCVAYSHWFEMNRKSESVPELREYVGEAHAHLKQTARGFGFFLDDTGRMNLTQPLPLQLKRKTKRRAATGKH